LLLFGLRALSGKRQRMFGRPGDRFLGQSDVPPSKPIAPPELDYGPAESECVLDIRGIVRTLRGLVQRCHLASNVTLNVAENATRNR
jgi:hypothetical protein